MNRYTDHTTTAGREPIPVPADSLYILETNTDCLICTNALKRFPEDTPTLILDVGCKTLARPEAEAMLADPELGTLRQAVCDADDPEDATFFVIVGERTAR